MKNLRFFKCPHCGNVVIKLVEKDVPIFCCGVAMEEIVPKTTDLAGEKHIPIFSLKGDLLTVKVGEVSHPMLDEHYINFVAVETASGFIVKNLNPNSLPETTFFVGDEKVKAVYEYCNLHGLWANFVK